MKQDTDRSRRDRQRRRRKQKQTQWLIALLAVVILAVAAVLIWQSTKPEATPEAIPAATATPAPTATPSPTPEAGAATPLPDTTEDIWSYPSADTSGTQDSSPTSAPIETLPEDEWAEN